ncbi:MAG: hypothetical protein GX139_11280 [Armatimonadetes bacterium]|jgi:hypothetical protein|nr:hypothetical protein [Armatimonadota bacterium]
MSDEIVLKTPNEELAVVVAKALKDAELVINTREADIVKKLTTGTAKAEDWNRWIEEALDVKHKQA